MKTLGTIAMGALLVGLVAFAGWPTLVDPLGPNSGASRTLAATWGTPPIFEPGHPTSGSGRTAWS